MPDNGLSVAPQDAAEHAPGSTINSIAHSPVDSPPGAMASSRRSFIMASVGALIAGCASSSSSVRLPDPHWRSDGSLARGSNSAAIGSTSGSNVSGGTVMPGVMHRSAWAGGRPDFSDMNRMTAVRYITVHHDGIDAFLLSDRNSVAARIETIRRSHRGQGWADIGYHYAVDRAGRVWACRPDTWQGAHVGNHNEGNIGVMALGNFEVQRPTEAQVSAIVEHVRALQSRFNVPVSRVKTHREWSATVCPGRTLQPRIDAARRQRMFG